MLTFITLPANFATDVASSTSDMISSFSPLLILIIGVLLVGVVIEIIIGALRK